MIQYENLPSGEVRVVLLKDGAYYRSFIAPDWAIASAVGAYARRALSENRESVQLHDFLKEDKAF